MYLTRDGLTFFADSAPDVVRFLRESSHYPKPTAEKFMRSVASAVAVQTGHSVRYDCPEHFVADLMTAGLISRHTIN